MFRDEYFISFLYSLGTKFELLTGLELLTIAFMVWTVFQELLKDQLPVVYILLLNWKPIKFKHSTFLLINCSEKAHQKKDTQSM